MSDSTLLPFSYNASTRVDELPKLQTGQIGYALLNEELMVWFQENQGALAETVSPSNSSPVIVPISADGNVLWDSLPAELALLAVPPHLSSVVVIPKEHVSAHSEGTLWELLIASIGEVDVKHLEVANEVSSLIDHPVLAPARSAIPSWLKQICEEYSPNEKITSVPDATAIKAGLLQIHDELDRSHDFSQDCQGRGLNVAGDYWHGIMHRREPDYSNSKYWFRRVGEHPVFSKLAHHAVEIMSICPSPDATGWTDRLTSGSWDPFAFVDLCETCETRNDNELTTAAKQIQWREMILLLKQTYLDAVGKN